MRYPSVAVLILNFNGLPFLKECLDGLSGSKYPALTTYVIDNGSVDGSCGFVSSNYPTVKVIKFERNLGFAEAYNKVVKEVDSDYVLLLNNDTEVGEDFVHVLVETAESDDRVGSVGCRIVQSEGYRRYGPVFFTGNRLYIGPLFFGSAIGKSAVYATYDAATECIANCGAAVLYRRSLINTIGLFDPDFWSDWEDHDLGFRICVAGYRNLYTPRTRVLHTGGASFGIVDSRRRAIRMTRNMLFTYVKNYEPRNIPLRLFPLLFCVLPFREIAVVLENELGMLFGRDIERRKKLRATYMTSPIAYWQFVRGLRDVLGKRQTIQRLRNASDRDIIRRTSKRLI